MRFGVRRASWLIFATFQRSLCDCRNALIEIESDRTSANLTLHLLRLNRSLARSLGDLEDFNFGVCNHIPSITILSLRTKVPELLQQGITNKSFKDHEISRPL